MNGAALQVNGTMCHYVCQADDVALVHNMFPGCIQTNLDIVHHHNKKWRYAHNSSKCKLIMFESAVKRNPPITLSGGVNNECRNSHTQRGGDVNGLDTVYLGDVALECVPGEKHMGVILGTDVSFIDKRIMKGKRATAAMQSLACSGSLLNPSIASRLYWTISMSTMLYGVEVWDLTNGDIKKLDLKAHVQMARNTQGLPGFVADVAVLAPLGWVSIQGYIDRRRLLFLWSILHLDVFCIYKQLCIYRLMQIRNNSSRYHSGPISDMYHACVKYELCDAVFEMLSSGTIPSRGVWKGIVSRKVMEHEHALWRLQVQMYSSLSVIHTWSLMD